MPKKLPIFSTLSAESPDKIWTYSPSFFSLLTTS